MLRQAKVIVINHMNLCIRKTHFFYQYLIPTAIRIECNLIIEFSQRETT